MWICQPREQYSCEVPSPSLFNMPSLCLSLQYFPRPGAWSPLHLEQTVGAPSLALSTSPTWGSTESSPDLPYEC